VVTQILSVDTGALNNLYPIITGTSDPGATVEVQISNLDLTLTADSEGNWTTGDQISDLSSIRGPVTATTQGNSNPVSVIFEIALPPDLVPTVTEGGVQVSLTGIPNATVDILADGDRALTITLGASEQVSLNIPLSPGTHFLQARYVDQSRIGPSSAPVTITVS